MGDFTTSIPAFPVGKNRAPNMQTLADLATAITAAWTTWAPTLTNLTLADGTVLAKYRRLGKTVDFRFKFKLGASSAVGTSPMFTLPAAASAEFVASPDFDRIGFGKLFDTSTTAVRDADPILISGSSSIQINHMAAGVTTNTTATVPWTWAVGDTLSVWGTYYTD